MGGALISPSAVTRPFKPLGNLLRRLLGGSSAPARPPKSLPDPRLNGSDTERRLSFMLESVPVNLEPHQPEIRLKLLGSRRNFCSGEPLK